MTDKRYEYTIYKICSDECGEFYIGSTRNMVQRKKNHKSSCNNPNSKGYNQKTYRTIRDNGGWDEFRMVPLELMENTTKFEAECREEVVRCELQAKMNSIRATRGNLSIQEYNRLYREENKDHIKENAKKYYQENKDHYKEHNKKYREEHKEHRKLYNEENKEQIREQKKQYYEEHKNEKKEHKKIYYEEHKEHLNTQRREKFECNCGGKFTRGGKSAHLRSIKHQKYLENET